MIYTELVNRDEYNILINKIKKPCNVCPGNFLNVLSYYSIKIYKVVHQEKK